MVFPEVSVLLLSHLLDLLSVGSNLHHGEEDPTVPEAEDLLTGADKLEAGMFRKPRVGRAVFTSQDWVEEDKPAAHNKHSRSEVKKIVHALSKAVLCS